jgi:hypothetical protein
MPVNKFDLTHNPVALYHFERNLNDSSGNGLHMAGTMTYRHVYPNVWGVVGGSPARPVSDALLRIAGDITIEVLCIMRVVPSGTNQIVMFLQSGNAESANAMYSIEITDQSNLRWRSEHGSLGTATTHTAIGANGAVLPNLGVPFLLQARRASGVVTFFINGEFYGFASPVITTPTGGTLSQLILRGGSTPPEIFGLKIIPSALTDEEIRAEHMRTLGDAFGPVQTIAVGVESLWAGALTSDGLTVAVRLTRDNGGVRLAITGPGGTTYTSAANTLERTVKLTATGLTADTAYTYQVQIDGVSVGPVCPFRTAPAAGPASFKVAFSGDANSGSNHAVFGQIKTENPLLFIHLGDLHYDNITSNTSAPYNAGFDAALAQPLQGGLYRDVPTAYVWDDHDYGADNSSASSPSHDAACATYRKRVPHYPLAESVVDGTIAQAFTIGRVLFLVTDQRSASDSRLDTDDANKTMLGATQKAWFKSQIAAADGMLIVWVCPRVWGGDTVYGADHWGGFATERTELIDYIHAEAPGRVVVLSADMHLMGIDDGTNHDFATGGGEPVKTFQCAPLDRTPSTPSGGLTYSEGVVLVRGVYGTMQVTDTGGATVDVLWEGRDSTGTLLTDYTFSVTL